MNDRLDEAVRRIILSAAERAILPHYRALEPGDVTEKSVGDVVTIADHAAEDILSQGLAKLSPGTAIVGEEAASEDPSIMERLNGSCWIIDPLDGTNNFAKGEPPFGIMVALSDGGETIAGWIYDPLTGRLCHSAKGEGAFINDTEIRSRATGHIRPVAAVSLIFQSEERRQALTEHVVPHYKLVDIPRCAAEQYPRLAMGQNDVSIFERTLAWDHAAGALWLNEAGGKVARPDGSAYLVDEYDRTGLIGAATPDLWDDLAAYVAAMPD